MKSINFTIITFCIAFLFSCNTQKQQDQNKPVTPEALQDKGSYSVITKRGNDNLLEKLYEELKEKTPELKALDKEIDETSTMQNDTIEAFNNYNQKNNTYYTSCKDFNLRVQDSTLKNKIKDLIENSISKYNSKINIHNKLISSINLKDATVNDLYTFLKIKLTLSVMEKYQNQSLPRTIGLENVVKRYDAVLKHIDSLIKK